MTTLLHAVRPGYQVGLCLLPVAEDGSKAPDVSSWIPFKTTRPTVEQMRGFDFAHRAGYGVIGGDVSGRIDPWDFDCADTFEAFVQAAHACGLGTVVDRIRQGYEDQTPSGGRRWLVRYSEDATFTDTALARRPTRPEERRYDRDTTKTLIEITTFSILAPSNGATHPSGKPYVHVSGDFTAIADYTEDERAALFALARSFDQTPRREHAPTMTTTRGTSSAAIKPGEDYNQRTTWPALLESAGWTHVFTRSDVSYWRRPGKHHGISATTNFGGSDLFYPFTSSSEFQPDRSYSRFGVFATLHYGGDFGTAARALSEQGYGTRIEARQAAYQDTVARAARQTRQAPVFAQSAVEIGAGQCVLRPLLQRPYSGWFARGAVHLVAGSSGAGKSTLMLDLLRTQAHGGRYLGHMGTQLDFLVLFADRGTVSNTETLQRMKIDPQTMPIDHLPPTISGEAARQAILATIERQPELPAVVFIEGADLLVEDPNKSPIVTAFVVGLRQIAEHYSLAVVLSVGSPKSRPHEQYVLKRDQVYGSQAWSRLSNTVLVLTVTGDGTVATRDLVVLHRNAGAEMFHLEFVDGLLIEAATSKATEPTMLEWMRDTEVFTKQKFREAFGLSGARATTLLDGYVAIGLLREKSKQDRTVYVFKRGSASKAGLVLVHPPEPVSVSDGFSDTLLGAEPESERVRKTTGHGHVNAETPRDIPSVSEPSSSSFLIPPFSCPLSVRTPTTEGVSDNGHGFRGDTRARVAEAEPVQGESPRRGEHGEEF